MDELDDILFVILGFVTAILITFMLYDFIKHEYKFKKYGFKFWRSSLDTIISLTILISYDIFAIHTTINRIYAIHSSLNTSFNPTWCKSLFFELSQFTPSKLLLYQFYILRLHKVFKSSSFAVPTFKLKLIAFFVSLPLIFSTIIGLYQYIISVQYNFNEFDITTFEDCSVFNDEHTSKTLELIKAVNVALYILAELIYSIIILRLFLSRVLLLTMSYDRIKASSSRSQINSVSATNRARSLSNVQSKSGSPSPMEHIDTTAPKTAYNQKMEAKNNELFLNLAIKTTNLIIMAVCANYIVAFKFALKIPTAILNIDALCNCLSVYLSYQFSSKYYDVLFSSCHRICYGCCVTLCYCCCLPTKLPPHLELEHVQNTHDDHKVDIDKNDNKRETAQRIEEQQSAPSVVQSRSHNEHGNISPEDDDDDDTVKWKEIAVDVQTDNKITVQHGTNNNFAVIT